MLSCNLSEPRRLFSKRKWMVRYYVLTIETDSIHVVRKFYCTHNKNEKITTANSINPMLMQKSRCLSCAPTVFHPRNGNRCFICPLLVTGRAESIHVAVRARPQDPAPQMAKAAVPAKEQRQPTRPRRCQVMYGVPRAGARHVMMSVT